MENQFIHIFIYLFNYLLIHLFIYLFIQYRVQRGLKAVDLCFIFIEMSW